MKKKAVSGVTALTMLASATIPVYAAPIEEGVNAKGLNNPISTAKPAVDPMNVYTSFTETNSSNSGDGSAESPYNRFEDAVAQVADGGTIYIKSDKGAFLNDVGGNLPFLIDKNVTIKPVDGANNATLSVRSAGIILGADVKFENITIDFANKYHDSIFANGYTLDLINVTRNESAREIDLFAGGLYKLDGTQIYPSGNKGVINIETNDNFGGGNLQSTFGNIYAGSMNGVFDGEAEINVSRKGTYKVLNIGAIKASGALEADAGNMLDTKEPLPPQANPEKYPVMRDVAINLHNYQIDIDGTTGSNAQTSVTTSTVYPSDLTLKNVEHLTVTGGHIIATYRDTARTSDVTLKNGATLDLTKSEKEFTIGLYRGDGVVVLRKDGKLNISNPINGSIELQTEGAFNGYSGLVEEDHVYITTPNKDANIRFTPHYTQEYLELVANKKGNVVEWKIQEIGEDEEPPVEDGKEDNETEVPPIEEVKPDAEGWLKATTFAQLNYLWDYSIDNDSKTVTLESFKGVDAKSNDIKVEIPREVEGYKVALENLNNETFKDVTHIRVEKGEGQVKVLAKELVRGFENNENLKYVDLEGLDVSEVTDMTMLFSGCSNLRVIDIVGWDIQYDTIITGMFYARISATEEEQEILVISDSWKISDYDFELSNRIPAIVRFSGNGGYFLGDKEILNRTFGHYVVATDSIEELEYLYDIYVELAGTPVQEGYEFKGWYTEDSEPTNVYELLNMTYKAKWEKVVEEEKPEQPPVEDDKPEQPPVEDDKPEQPPVEDDKTDEGENGDTTPPTVTPQPPVSGGGAVQPPVEVPPTEEEEITPPVVDTPTPTPKPPVSGGGSAQPPVENVPTNGIENLKDLDKELQEKVDSLIAESVLEKQGLVLSIVGDDDDLNHVSHVEITSEGIFATVDGKELKFVNSLDGLELDLKDARAVRVVDEGKRAVTYKAVPHQNTKDGLKISSDNLEDILITSKVSEPFADVSDKDWFKEDVEEAFNYGFTTGTTATTYNPYADITRAQFAVMIARALELKPASQNMELKDVKGRWYQNEAQALYEAGIIKGFGDGTFGGGRKLTRQQAVAMLGRMLEYVGVDTKVEDDVKFADMDKIGENAQQSVKFLASNGVLVSGENTKFNPYNNLTRAQMAKMLVRSLRLTDLY